MKAIIFGATGMVGQGVLAECLRDAQVEQVLVIGRTPTGRQHEKLKEIHHDDFLDFSLIEQEVAGYDACFFCLGVSSVGMRAATYDHITCDITLAAARVVLARNPDLTFIYISGQGTDSSEKGRVRWARTKGRTENALFELSSRAVMFRPGYIHPGPDITSKTRLYALTYVLAKPIYPLLGRLAPNQVTTTERVGKAMIAAARENGTRRILSTVDINALASCT